MVFFFHRNIETVRDETGGVVPTYMLIHRHLYSSLVWRGRLPRDPGVSHGSSSFAAARARDLDCRLREAELKKNINIPNLSITVSVVIVTLRGYIFRSNVVR